MPLNSISPIDGRYRKYTEKLSAFFSEEALMKYRVVVECEYFMALLTSGNIMSRKISAKEAKLVKNIYSKFNSDSFEKIKEYEDKTNHDVKAVEYFIKESLSKTSLNDSIEWVHFGLTSEDINNIAYALIISDGLEQAILPKLNDLTDKLSGLIDNYKDLPMLARTHGQPASPTTFGKEINVFSNRITRAVDHLLGQKIQIKLSGATGNFNAHHIAFPKVDWIKFATNFAKGFNKKRIFPLELNLVTTQIEPHDSYVEVFDRIRRINTYLIDFNQDIWRYISDNWIIQKPKATETGSSTMPHKINPIDFENSEGNLGIANALFEFFGRKLPISRLQRDLSDSTVERAFGTAFAHSFIGYQMLERGLGKISVNDKKILEDLNSHPEVITEAIQTILRREGQAMPYEKLKELSRGKEITLADIHKFINDLQVSDKIKKELLKITPQNYTGLASKLAGMTNA